MEGCRVQSYLYFCESKPGRVELADNVVVRRVLSGFIMVLDLGREISGSRVLSSGHFSSVSDQGCDPSLRPGILAARPRIMGVSSRSR